MITIIKSKKDENTKNELMKAIRPKFEAWYETEILNFRGRGVLRKADLLMNKLKNSDVANAIGLWIFKDVCCRVKTIWYKYLNRQFTGNFGIMTSNDILWKCYMTYITSRNVIMTPDYYSFKTVNELKTILEALKAWERETMVNTKLNSIEEDFN